MFKDARIVGEFPYGVGEDVGNNLLAH